LPVLKFSLFTFFGILRFIKAEQKAQTYLSFDYSCPKKTCSLQNKNIKLVNIKIKGAVCQFFGSYN